MSICALEDALDTPIAQYIWNARYRAGSEPSIDGAGAW